MQVFGADEVYRLITTLQDAEQAPAEELAVLYHERWEIEGALDELKTHLRGRQIILRSKTPELVRQEFYGLMMAHYAIRGLMHEAALKAEQLPRPSVVRSRRARDSSQTASFRCYSPLGRGNPFMKPCSMKYYKNASPPAGAGAIPAR